MALVPCKSDKDLIEKSRDNVETSHYFSHTDYKKAQGNLTPQSKIKSRRILNTPAIVSVLVAYKTKKR